MGLFPFRIAKLEIKKPMEEEISIGVKLWGVGRKVEPFYGSFWEKMPQIMGVDGS